MRKDSLLYIQFSFHLIDFQTFYNKESYFFIIERNKITK